MFKFANNNNIEMSKVEDSNAICTCETQNVNVVSVVIWLSDPQS